MSLYNTLFGVNSLTPILLQIAGIDMSEIARFRDCYIKEGDVIIYTRTGGGNRECYSSNDEHSDCYHTFNDKLTEKPNFVTDYDDDFDSTYAYFVFAPLAQYKDLAISLESNEPGVGEKFSDLIEKMKVNK